VSGSPAPVLVLVELGDGEADRVSLETLAFARGLGAGPIEAVAFGGPASVAASLGVHGASVVHHVSDGRFEAYSPSGRGAALAGLARDRNAFAVIGPGTDRGSEVVAHAAARLGAAMAANVLSVEVGSSAPAAADTWRLTRQRWGGSLLEDAVLGGSPKLLTMAAHAVAASEVAGAAPAQVLTVAPTVSDADLAVRVVSHEAPVAGAVSLADAKVVVSGGRGVGSSAGFAVIEELAGLLGAAVGVSRAVTSAGWRPHAEQVGQTGTRVAPEIYIACGISGAIQHIVGCKSAKRILAINTDPDSPIMQRAQYAVIGDLHQVVPAVVAEIRRRSG
jgi:electron transfer flavoprotein alpha subunit